MKATAATIHPATGKAVNRLVEIVRKKLYWVRDSVPPSATSFITLIPPKRNFKRYQAAPIKAPPKIYPATFLKIYFPEGVGCSLSGVSAPDLDWILLLIYSIDALNAFSEVSLNLT
ncbi:hypothetical protein ES705_46759 [subsurface metagenome]